MPSRPSRSSVPLALGLAATLAGCAHRADLAVAPAPAEAPPPRPTLAPVLAAVKPPPVTPDGGYRTINSGIDEAHAVWHVRAALNVAAIGCRADSEAGIISAYNAMLTAQRATFARANEAVRADVRAQGGDPDAYMTKLYNYFALPPAKPAFCAAAATLAPKAAATAPEAFPAFARTALATLETPFLDIYRTVDGYRLASAAWDARYGNAGTPREAVAAAAPAAPAIAAAEGLPRGTSAGAGHYDLPRALPAHHAVAAAAPANTRPTAPRLAYADLGDVVAWQPARRAAYAAR